MTNGTDAVVSSAERPGWRWLSDRRWRWLLVGVLVIAGGLWLGWEWLAAIGALPLVPGYLSFVAGRSVDELQARSGRERLAVLGMSLAFVLGFSTVFVMLGASATALGRLVLAYKHEANLVGGVIIIVFGLFMTGLLNLRWLNLDLRWVHRFESSRASPLSAYLLGLAFAFGWTPCIGPILGKHSHGQCVERAHRKRHYAARRLFAWPRAAVSADRALHRAFPRAFKEIAALEPADLHRQRRHYGAHWGPHDHRASHCPGLLAVEPVSGSRADRMMPTHVRFRASRHDDAER